MKLTVKHTEMAQRAIKAHCRRKDKAPMIETGHVFGYINKLNLGIGPFQTAYHNLDLDEMKMPQGLAQFLEPRHIRYDITNMNQENLIDSSVWDNPPLKYDTIIEDLTEEEKQQWLEELKVEHPDAKIEDVPATKETQVVNRKSREAQMQTCPDWYEYPEFLADLQTIRTALGIRDASDSTNVLDAIQDINILTITDKLVVNGCIKWDGKVSNAFIPYYVKGFNVGLNPKEYFDDVDFMLEMYFTKCIIDIFTK